MRDSKRKSSLVFSPVPAQDYKIVGCGGSGFKTTCSRASHISVGGTGVQNLKAWATSFNPLCPCLSEETVKTVDPFYLVPMPGGVKDPTQGNGKYL